MAPKKKAQKISNRTKVFILIGLLGAVAALFIFVTLPALGIHIIPTGTQTQRATPAPRTPPPTTPGAPTTTQPVASVTPGADVRQALQHYTRKSETTVQETWFIPDVITFDDPVVVSEMLMSKDQAIQEIQDIIYLTFFINDEGQKKAWVRQTRNPSIIHEVNLESKLPGYPQLHILDITPMGILLYYLNPDDPSGKQQQIFRLRAQPYKS